MLNRKARIGQEIAAFCGKCKMERTHTITAMADGDKVSKVTCSTCHSLHAYRTKTAGEGAGKPAKAKTTRTKKSKEPGVFTLDPKRPVKHYNWDSNFSTGDVINHPTFGLGSVEATHPPNKIQVRFEQGTKVLVHNLKEFR